MMSENNGYPRDRPFIAQLLRSLTATDDPKDHNRILRELDNIGGNEVYEALLGLLDTEQGELRYRVLSTLTGIDPNRAQHLLVDVMNNSKDSDMQWTASFLLLNVATAEILDSLIEALLKHPDARIRVNVVTVLEKLGDSRALPALRYVREHDRGKTDDGYAVRGPAERAIQRIENGSKGEDNPQG